MYPFPIGSFKTGMTRQRTKAGASPESLYLLQNAYIASSRDVVPRGGSTLHHTLPAGTVGLAFHKGKRHVFANAVVTMTNPAYVCNVLPHPKNPANTLSVIHYAKPLLGFLFVVAEYSNGDVFYFWLTHGSRRNGEVWLANAEYRLGEMIEPTVPNGYLYEATRRYPPAKPWAPDVPRAVNDKVAPTVYNGYEYQVIETVGPNPRSGTTEPPWAVFDGGITTEQIDTDPDNQDTPSTPTVPGGGGTGGDGTGGGGGGGEGPYDNPYCLCLEMELGKGFIVEDMAPGQEHDCWTPERGFYRGIIESVGSLKLQDCVRMRAGDHEIWCSTTTTFTLPGAASDNDPAAMLLATQMLGREVHTDAGVRVVDSIEPMGRRWTLPVRFQGGASFAAGVNPERRIFSHNARKVTF